MENIEILVQYPLGAGIVGIESLRGLDENGELVAVSLRLSIITDSETLERTQTSEILFFEKKDVDVLINVLKDIRKHVG